MNFEEVLLSVLEDFKDINLHSEAGRGILVKEMMVRIKDPNAGWFLDFSGSISEYKNKKRQALGGDYIYSRDLFEKKQLEIFESPDGGKTIRTRKVDDFDGYTNEAYEKFLDEHEGVSKVIPQDTRDKKDEEYDGGHLG